MRTQNKRRHMPHTIDEDELLDHLKNERWEIYASSSREPKRLEVLINGQGFRVTVRDEIAYKGQNVSDAVRAYNEAA